MNYIFQTRGEVFVKYTVGEREIGRDVRVLLPSSNEKLVA